MVVISIQTLEFGYGGLLSSFCKKDESAADAFGQHKVQMLHYANQEGNTISHASETRPTRTSQIANGSPFV